MKFDVTFDASSATNIATMLNLVSAQEEGLVGRVLVPEPLRYFSVSGPAFPARDTLDLTNCSQELGYLRNLSISAGLSNTGIEPSNPFGGLAILSMALSDGRFELTTGTQHYMDAVRVHMPHAEEPIFGDWATLGTTKSWGMVGPDLGGHAFATSLGVAVLEGTKPIIGDQGALFELARRASNLKLGVVAQRGDLTDPVVAHLQSIPTKMPWEDLYRFAQDASYRHAIKALLATPTSARHDETSELALEGLCLGADLALHTHGVGVISFLLKCWRARLTLSRGSSSV